MQCQGGSPKHIHSICAHIYLHTSYYNAWANTAFLRQMQGGRLCLRHQCQRVIFNNSVLWLRWLFGVTSFFISNSHKEWPGSDAGSSGGITCDTEKNLDDDGDADPDFVLGNKIKKPRNYFQGLVQKLTVRILQKIFSKILIDFLQIFLGKSHSKF